MSDRNIPSAITVYEVKTYKEPQTRLVLSYEAAMGTIAHSLSGSVDIINDWKERNEFPGLDTPELAGNFNHRIRYELNRRFNDNEVREFTITEHLATNDLYPSRSFMRVIVPGLEFDPSYELQAALIRVSRGEETVMEAADFLKNVVELNIRSLGRRLSADQIVAGLDEVQHRTGGRDFSYGSTWRTHELVASYPALVYNKFRDLAAEAFPSHSMKM